MFSFHFLKALSKQLFRLLPLWFIVSLTWLNGCGAPLTPPSPTPPKLAEELTVYGWIGYMPQSVLDAFSKEYGVKVNYVVYKTQEEPIANLQAGKIYDVVFIDSEFIQGLLAGNLLAEIDLHHLPNFKNVSANFRDLAYDPGNKHSIMFEWGTTGLIVRQDLVEQPITRWADLWDQPYAGKIGIWPLQRPLIAIALKSLGHSANSENPVELEEALQHLLELKSNAFFLDLNQSTSSAYLLEGKATVVYGWSTDVLNARQQNNQIAYVLPKEGTLLWGDNLIIPANSPNKYTAHLFINFLLRPEISAEITNEIFVATTNEAAQPFIKPEIRNEPIIFPSNTDLKNAEIAVPLNPQAKKLYDEIWTRFMNSPVTKKNESGY